MNVRKLASGVVIAAFLSVTVLPVSADDTMESLAIIGPAVLGVGLLITLIAVLGTRSTDKPQAETSRRDRPAVSPEQQAASVTLAMPEPRPPVSARAGNPGTSRHATGFVMLCPQSAGGISVACW